jgi:transcriptional regulator with XRE-family HTH domain
MESKSFAITANDVRTRLAANLRRLRAERDISQERLALEAGVDRTMLSKIERQISNPSIETLLKLSNRLAVDIVALLAPAEEVRPPRGLSRAGASGRPAPSRLAVHEPSGRPLRGK